MPRQFNFTPPQLLVVKTFVAYVVLICGKLAADVVDQERQLRPWAIAPAVAARLKRQKNALSALAAGLPVEAPVVRPV